MQFKLMWFWTNENVQLSGCAMVVVVYLHHADRGGDGVSDRYAHYSAILSYPTEQDLVSSCIYDHAW